MNTSHVFHEIYLHIIWHVKFDKATLRDNIEKLTHRFLMDRCNKTKGVTLHGLGGTDTHIHLAVDIEPAVTISDLVKTLKGGSSHDLNTELRRKELQWQRGYGCGELRTQKPPVGVGVHCESASAPCGGDGSREVGESW